MREEERGEKRKEKTFVYTLLSSHSTLTYHTRGHYRRWSPIVVPPLRNKTKTFIVGVNNRFNYVRPYLIVNCKSRIHFHWNIIQLSFVLHQGGTQKRTKDYESKRVRKCMNVCVCLFVSGRFTDPIVSDSCLWFILSQSHIKINSIVFEFRITRC